MDKSFKVTPHVPENAIGDERLKTGVAIKLLKIPIHYPRFGPRDLGVKDGSWEVIAPAWALTHMLLRQYSMKLLPESRRIFRYVTSTAYVAGENGVNIVHQAEFGNNTLSFSQNFGLSISIKNFPSETISIEKLIDDYPEAAKAITLLDSPQLEQLLSLNAGRSGFLYIKRPLESEGLFEVVLRGGTFNFGMAGSFAEHRMKKIIMSGKGQLSGKMLDVAQRLSIAMNQAGYLLGQISYTGQALTLEVKPDSPTFDMAYAAADIRSEIDRALLPFGAIFHVKGISGTVMVISGHDNFSREVLRTYATVAQQIYKPA